MSGAKNAAIPSPLNRLDLLQRVLAALPVGVWIVDEAGKVIYENPAAWRIRAGGAGPGTPGEQSGWGANGKRPQTVEGTAVQAMKRGQEAIDEELQIECLDGSRKTILSSAMPIHGEDGRIAGAIVVYHDITDRKRYEERLREMVDHDALTGACSRRRLYELLEEEADRARRYGTRLSLLMFDLDHFKKVNDEHGHQAGDRVLAAIAKCVREELRSVDILARYGGEEFVVVAPGIARDQAAILAERLRARIAGTQFDSLPRITCSFGVCEYAGSSADDFIRRADELMYDAKRAGRNRVAVEAKA